MQEHISPLLWVRQFISAMQWPVVVGGAFVLGRYVRDLEVRLKRAESNLSALIERHMPAIHRALSEIRGLLIARGE